MSIGVAYTAEEDEFLNQYYSTMPIDELVLKLNEKFGNNRTKKSVYIRNHNYLHNNNRQCLPIGTERIHHDCIWVKVSNYPVPKHEKKTHDYRSLNWKPKHRVVWEREYGEIPEDTIIIFLDGNPHNCDIENLYMVSKWVNSRLCLRKWRFEDLEMTKTAIKCVELEEAIKNVKKESRDRS